MRSTRIAALIGPMTAAGYSRLRSAEADIDRHRWLAWTDKGPTSAHQPKAVTATIGSTGAGWRRRFRHSANASGRACGGTSRRSIRMVGDQRRRSDRGVEAVFTARCQLVPPACHCARWRSPRRHLAGSRALTGGRLRLAVAVPTRSVDLWHDERARPTKDTPGSGSRRPLNARTARSHGRRRRQCSRSVDADGARSSRSVQLDASLGPATPRSPRSPTAYNQRNAGYGDGHPVALLTAVTTIKRADADRSWIARSPLHAGMFRRLVGRLTASAANRR